MSDAPRADKPSGLERLLNVFAEVRNGEGATVVLLFLNIFLILTAYYVLKVVRGALIVGGAELWGIEGDELKAYMSATMALLLIGIVPAYGYLASRVDRIRLISTTMVVVIGALLGFAAWGLAAGVGTAIGLSFFIFLGIVNVFLIAQFWSFANDIYTEAQGKRLFAIIAIGGSLGAVLGPPLAALGAEHTFLLLLGTAAAFAVCLALYVTVNRREDAAASQEEARGKPLEKDGGFQLVFTNRYLLLIAFMILVTNLVNTTGEFVLDSAALDFAEREASPAIVLGEDVQARLEADSDFSLSDEQEQTLKERRSAEIGRFYGNFFLFVNIAGLFIQAFLVSRIFKYLGVRTALFILPVIALGGYAAIGLIGGLLVIRVAKTAENSTDYSLQNTLKQALFLPTSREAKYKAKAAIDTFFVRFGDAASAGLVGVGLHVLAFETREFAFVNVGLCVVWILLSVGIAREHRKLQPDDTADEVKS